MGRTVKIDADDLDRLNGQFSTPSLDETTVGKLRQHVDRIRSLKEEIKALNSDVKDQFTVASSDGFDPAVLKILIKRLDADQQELALQDDLLEVYENAYRTAAA